MTLSEAAKHAGVPEVQLLRWAGWSLSGVPMGPRFTGHPINPKRMEYAEADLTEWKAAMAQKVTA